MAWTDPPKMKPKSKKERTGRDPGQTWNVATLTDPTLRYITTAGNLNIFCVHIDHIASINNMRRIYMAFREDVDRPMMVAQAVVMPRIEQKDGAALDFPPVLDWIEVASEYRRQGYGTVLVDVLRRIEGKDLHMHGATPEGRGFCKALGVEVDDE